MLLLALWSPIDAAAAPLVDMAQGFTGINDLTFSGAVTTQNGHSGTWVSGYPTDTWAADLAYGVECVRPLTDDSVGTWGGVGEAVDDHLTYNGREWRDLQIDARLHQNNNTGGEDALGVVFRWTDSSNFYVAFATRESAPGTGTGTPITVAPAVFLYRVAGGVATQLGTVAT